jgi:hypothetical protein
MTRNKPTPSFIITRWTVLFLGTAVLAVQIMAATHMHADGENHADCPLCLLSGTLQSPNIINIQLEKPLQYSQKVSPIIDSFICIYFRGFLYTPCGPPKI